MPAIPYLLLEMPAINADNSSKYCRVYERSNRLNKLEEKKSDGLWHTLVRLIRYNLEIDDSLVLIVYSLAE